jgi:hypothetical protein
MNKQEYLIYVQTKNWTQLIFEYHLEVGKVKKSREELVKIVNHWNRLEVNTGGMFSESLFDFNHFIAYIIKYFANKFEIVKIYNKDNKLIKTT